MKTDERAKIIDQLMRSLWESLESHLEYTHTTHTQEGVYGKDRKFHRECVKDYATQIHLASQLL